MTLDWNREAKTLTASFALAKVTDRFSVDLDADLNRSLAVRMERAAFRFHLTHGLKRELPNRTPHAPAIQATPRAVGKLISKLRNDLARAKANAWKIQHVVATVLEIEGQPVIYGTPRQHAGAAFAAEFLDRPDMAVVHPAGLIDVLDALMEICTDQLTKVVAAEVNPPVEATATEDRLFCRALSDIYRAAVGREPVARSGSVGHPSGRSPFVDFAADAWGMAGARRPPGPHAIATMLSAPGKAHDYFRG